MGYTPTSVLPILLPPATGADTYYAGLASHVELVPHEISGVVLTVRDMAPDQIDLFATLYVPHGSSVFFLAAGGTLSLPDGGPVDVSTIMLSVSPMDYQALEAALPEGIVAPAFYTFENVDQTSFENGVPAWISEIPEFLKQQIWNASPPSDPTLSLDDNLRNNVMAGTFGVSLIAARQFGLMEGDGTGSFSVRIRVYDVAGVETNPAPLLAAMDQLNPALLNHPVRLQAAQIAVQTEIHIGFRYWDVTHPDATTPKGSWVMLAGATVDIVDADVNFDDVLASGTTDDAGVVSFHLDPPAFDGNDFYFRVTTPNPIVIQYGRPETWTGTWSTRGWTSVDGQPGYYENFSGYMIGSGSHPLIFNLGLPVFLDLHYHFKDESDPLGAMDRERPVAPGTLVTLRSYHWEQPPTGEREMRIGGSDTFHADRDAELWGTSFNIIPDEYIEIELPLKLEDPDIELPLISTGIFPEQSLYLIFSIDDWKSSQDPANGFYGEDWTGSGVGMPEPGRLQRIVVSDRFELQAAALFILKVIRDTHQWFHLLTDGDWKGVHGLTVYFNEVWPTGASVTPPHYGILYDSSHIWNRSVIAHEYGHAVTWEYIPYNVFVPWEPTGLLWKSISGAYVADHRYCVITNGVTAFMDGWSLLVQLALDLTLPWSLTPGPYLLKDTTTDPPTWKSMSTLPLVGLNCEGCFAQCFWDYLKIDAHLQATSDTDKTDLTDVNSSLADPLIRTKFQQAIWQPMKLLGNNLLWADPNGLQVIDFVNAAGLEMTATEYGLLDPRLTSWNLK